MSEKDESNRGSRAVLVAIAIAVSGYLPAAYVYDTVTRWVNPMVHAEEAMGRGIEVLFFGGPLVAFVLAVVAGWLTYRSRSPATTSIALAAIASFALASVVIARWTRLL